MSRHGSCASITSVVDRSSSGGVSRGERLPLRRFRTARHRPAGRARTRRAGHRLRPHRRARAVRRRDDRDPHPARLRVRPARLSHRAAGPGPAERRGHVGVHATGRRARMTTKHVISLIVVIAGCSVVGLAPLAAWVFRTPLDRLHFVPPITSLGVPLVAVGVAIDEGPDLTTGLVLITAVLLAVTGPVLGMAAARATVPDD